MPNHVHLLVEHPPLELGKGMKLLNGRYARWFNLRYGRVGHVFEARYHPEPVQRDEHLLEAARPTGIPIGDEGNLLDGPVLCEQRADAVLGRGERKVAYV